MHSARNVFSVYINISLNAFTNKVEFNFLLVEDFFAIYWSDSTAVSRIAFRDACGVRSCFSDCNLRAKTLNMYLNCNDCMCASECAMSVFSPNSEV